MTVEELSSYEIIEKREIRELNSVGYYMKHKKTGAKVCLLSNDDENKVFYIGFRTPVSDSTGVPHILEHSVLCGSKEFPVKDPFVELAKGSLNTFLNAMTYPDKTVYPVASCNDKDFQNLIHVYMDAVFYPNIYQHEEIFRQEGWHYEMEDPDGELTINGVVYNEMKGAFSSPDSMLERAILNELYPDTTYSNESGGDPDVIPTLKYEDFLDFHRRYYHPSNSYIYLYGNCDMAEKLTWLDENYLKDFDCRPVDSEVGTQAPFEKMRETVIEYPISEGENEEDNTYLTYNKSVGDTLDEKLYLGMQVVEYVLLTVPGAPLKQALLDAGIGQDITGSYDNGVKQPIFSVTARNANADQKDAFVATIEDTLRKIVKEGIGEKALRAGINYFEFRYREADFGNYPAGLMYGLQAFDSWLYDDDSVFLHLEANDTFAFLKDNVDKGYFEGLIEKYILDNPHGCLVTAVPKRGLTREQEGKLREKLVLYRDGLTKEERQRIVDDTKHLKAYQSEPSSQEDLAKVPLLERSDISRESMPLKNEETDADGVKVVYHDYFTNGIGYVSLIFKAGGIREDLIPYLGFLRTVLGNMDMEHYSYNEFAQEEDLHTGGISCATGLYDDLSSADGYTPVFEVGVKAFYSELPKAFGLIKEMLLSSKLEDRKRLKELVAEVKSGLQAGFLSAGHQAAAMRARSYFSKSALFSDKVKGVDYYRFIEDLDGHFEEKWEEAASKLKELIEELFTSENLIVSYTGERTSIDALTDQVVKFAGALPKGADAGGDDSGSTEAAGSGCGSRDAEGGSGTGWNLVPEVKNEGLKTSAQIQYVCRAGDFSKAGLEYTGTLNVLRVIMSYGYLWNNIRVLGGAYGCMNGYFRNGSAYFVSYRDPNLERTNKVFEDAAAYIADFEETERDMTKYVIGAIAVRDTPLTPKGKGVRSMNAWMTGLTIEQISLERQQILDCSCADIRALAPYLKAMIDGGCICVIGNEGKIEENKDLFGTTESLFH